MSIETHVNQLNEKSKGLKRLIAGYNEQKCPEAIGVTVPAEVVEFAEVERWEVRVEVR